jgi:hypothetical protein
MPTALELNELLNGLQQWIAIGEEIDATDGGARLARNAGVHRAAT